MSDGDDLRVSQRDLRALAEAQRRLAEVERGLSEEVLRERLELAITVAERLSEGLDLILDRMEALVDAAGLEPGSAARDNLVRGLETARGALGGVTEGATRGATLGAALGGRAGPLGAAIGAGVGLVTGSVVGATQESARRESAAGLAQAANQDFAFQQRLRALEQARASPDNGEAVQAFRRRLRNGG